MALLKHGLDINNEIVSINDVTSGFGCNCKCPSCGEKLVAKKGEIKQWHFAHNSNESCAYAEQTAVHLIAKDIIAKHGVFLPKAPFNDFVKNQLNELNSSSSIKSTVLTQTGGYIRFNKITLEKKIGNIIPDIIAEYNGVTILIEIAVTHFIDSIKLEKLKTLGLPCLEIDCSHLRNSENLEDDLIQFLLAEDKKKWIIPPIYTILDPENLIAQKNTLREQKKTILEQMHYVGNLQMKIIPIEKRAKINYRNQKLMEGLEMPQGFDIEIKKEVCKSRNEIEFYSEVVQIEELGDLTIREVINYQEGEPVNYENISDKNLSVLAYNSHLKAYNWLLNHFKQIARGAYKELEQLYKELEQAKIELANLEKDYNPEIEVVIKCEI